MLLSTTITAGTTLEFYEKSNFFRLMDSASDVSVRFYNNGAEVARAENIGEGYAEKFETGEFDRIQIDSAATQTIQFVTRLGNVVSYDTPPVGNVAVTNNNGAFTQTGGISIGTGGTTLLAANPNRRYLLVQNRSTTISFFLCVDGAAATVGRGIELEPGASIAFEDYVPTGAITAITSSGTSTLTRVVEG